MGITLAVNLKHMDAKELRIGNWVLHKYLSYTKESESYFAPNKIRASDLVAMESFPDNFQPIPLTPEILEKAGFVNDDVNRFFKDPMYILSYDEGCLYLANQRHVNVFYVHQLQNIYFDLTDEELKIEL